MGATRPYTIQYALLARYTKKTEIGKKVKIPLYHWLGPDWNTSPAFKEKQARNNEKTVKGRNARSW
jgi:hypothetical protein